MPTFEASPPRSGGPAGRRDDLDGLRGVAVTSVVLFHAGFSQFSGGFVGVDVFLVISGYLIASQLRAQALRGRISLFEFAERRIRRLVPVNLLVTVVALISFGFVAHPDIYVALAKAALANLTSLSNVFYYRSADYFGAAAETQPLLHTWSLSLEIQLYAFFAIIYVMIAGRSWAVQIRILLLLTVVSFLCCLVLTARSQPGAFYLPLSRFWQFGLGALIALWPAEQPRSNLTKNWKLTFEIAATLCVCAILACVLVYDRSQLYPGSYALIPAIATAGIMALGTLEYPLLVTRALAAAPLAYLGRISYSWYLWHWVIFVFCRSIDAFSTTTERWLAIAMSLIVSAVCYRYIEEPIHRRRALVSLPLLRMAMAGGGALVASLVFGIVVTGGLPQRFSAPVVAAEPIYRFKECFDDDSTVGIRSCRVGAKQGVPRFLAVGDSHNLSMIPALDAAGTEHGVAGHFMGTSGCLPFFGVVPVREPASRSRCAAMMSRLAELLESQPDIEAAILVVRWAYYTTVDPVSGVRQAIAPPGGVGGNLEAARALFRTQFQATVDYLTSKGLLVFVLKQVPHHARTPIEVSAAAQVSGRDVGDYGVSFEEHARASQFAVETFATRPEVLVLDADPILCPDGKRCLQFKMGDPLYSDRDHLNTPGSLWVMKNLSPMFERLRRSRMRRRTG